MHRQACQLTPPWCCTGASAVLGFVAIVLAFWLPPATPHGFIIFMIIFAVGELAIFAGTAPSGAVK